MSVDDVVSVSGLLAGFGVAGLLGAVWWFGPAQALAFGQRLFDGLAVAVALGVFAAGTLNLASNSLVPGLTDASTLPQTIVTSPVAATTPVVPAAAATDAPQEAPVASPVAVVPQMVEPAVALAPPIRRAEPAVTRPRSEAPPRQAAARPAAERRMAAPASSRERVSGDRLFVGTVY